ncbi:PAS domain-containing sensor histidine kinase [Hymenobacter elongatus]|uniref:histidine kinase n=1 Tax=Hymenobacter elongatus TaxID=877208 RepID=A0A4Z0PIK6_9BACT|nr:PAS domain-containing sensor histidine kinase [Hymenobacter elongatus]TGE14711.1 PAS domain-containing sensor histidine kinase [Hymenobacter elongatus]
MLPPAAAAIAPADALLRELLAVSLTGIIFYTPLYDSAGSGEIVDFTFEYLNPAAQRMMRMPEQPALTHNEQWPQSKTHGTFRFHVDAFVSGEPREYTINYQADGYDNYYRLAARRAGSGLLVSVTDTADQPRSPVEIALREAQARTEQQRAQLEGLFMQAPAALCRLDGPELVYTLVNPVYQQLFPSRPLLGLPLLTALPELRGHAVWDILQRVYHSGHTHVDQGVRIALARRADGPLEDLYFNHIFQPDLGADGRPRGVVVYAFDVTREVRASQELEGRVSERTNAALAFQADVLAAAQRQVQERQAFHDVFEQTPALIALLGSPGHRFEYVNPAYQALFPGRQLVGLHLDVAVPELRAQGFVEVLDRVYQTGETFLGEEVAFTLTPPEGQPPRTRYYNFTYQAYREAGEIAGVSSFAYDVTEQVLARQEREAQRQRLHSLFMQAPAAICILDGPNLVFELVNPSYQALFPDRQLHGRPLLDALPEIADHAVSRTFRAVYETGVTHEEKGILVPLDRPDGTLEDRYFNYIQQARRNAYGQPDGVLVFAFEVTDQVHARQQAQALAAELTTANQQLTRTNVDLDTFIYTASHDLKAPITNIEGLLHTLQHELPPQSPAGEIAYILDLMQDSVNRFTRTIEHLTDVSKLQREHDQPAVAVALAPLIEDVRLDLAPLLHQTGGRLLVDVRPTPTITFAEKNLRSVVYNLLSNALKYHHPDRPPQVKVRSRAEATYSVLEVQDNGLGIDLTREQPLFQLFQRYHTHVEGTGVGLFMVKRMVENGGGRIEVVSKLGQGTTFSVYFPRLPPQTS